MPFVTEISGRRSWHSLWGLAVLAILVLLLAVLFLVSCYQPIQVEWSGRGVKFGYYVSIVYGPDRQGWRNGNITFRRFPRPPARRVIYPANGELFSTYSEVIGSYRVEWNW